ncbi:MAG: cupin domain-containing protein [Candidatus Dojkabacteria bacterium]|nr:MAG: cupin domain-containing protein [Candidatus Dojkabacteria bacterium]
MDRPSVVTIAEKLALFNEHWSPKIIGELNDDKVQVVKLKGEFTWHSHDIEDELFLVLEGELLIHFRDKTETLKKGEMLIIPHGIEHKPEAIEEVHILLIEPKGTVNTGNSRDTSLTAEEATI